MLSTVCLLIPALGILSSGANAATVKYVDHDPLGGMRPQFIKDVWLNEIEKQTDGKVKFQDFFGGTLFSSKESLKGVGDGIAEMGFVYPGHYPKRLIAHSVFSMFPTGPNTFEQQVWLYRKAYEEVPELKAELAKAGVMPLMLTAGLPGAFASVNPVTSIHDIKSEKWRAGGKWLLRYLQAVGASPVAVPWGDIYVALQTGTIDGVFTNYDGLHAMKFDEVAPHMLMSKRLWFPAPFIHVANIRFFNRLPEEVQEAILNASKIAEQKFAPVWDAEYEKIKREQLAAGYTLTEMSDEDLALWENKEKLTELQNQWVEEAKKAGLTDAAEIMEKVRKIHAVAIQQ
ncbi:TRAP transporter substrate-binding protein DctP [Photobacterium sp. GJ3]|uniref:TRAP transporter substrate-binding protein DctP n=1 Tax=Photobacterium sp. GJ3 TaxID=2829502 RepID=UPI001B8C6148|nr:TRAP transporter substrate-binding protein DctP [Photobacterium sp. GJ3]QUJ68534.1 TRAP transporter substrate-binding protein DctP [Photobacterium sp. GJ3]